MEDKIRIESIRKETFSIGFRTTLDVVGNRDGDGGEGGGNGGAGGGGGCSLCAKSITLRVTDGQSHNGFSILLLTYISG
ncbi:hypothetical protein M0802_009292 [Mischocyttarus mexicanus]|nr:hypothetical protein M0802_009292 [Mischocyttarus mexicanus]